MKLRGLRALLTILGILAAASCNQDQEVLHFWVATPVAPLGAEASLRFEKNNPSVRVEVTSMADLEMIGRIRSGETPPDLVAVTDGDLLGKLLGPRFLSSYRLLAGDEVVLASGDPDLWKNVSELSDWRLNWPHLIFQRDLRVAVADPARESLGYFSRLCWKLAEIHSDRQGLYQRFLLATRDQATSGSSQLVERLRAGEIDVAFLFLSTALQNDLRHLRLPPEMSLGSSSHEASYSRVFERVAGQGAGFPLEVHGHSIRYALAHLRNGNAWGTLLEDFLSSGETQNLFRAMGYRELPFETVQLGPPVQ